MKKAALIIATLALGATAITAPAEARGRGFGPGIGFGIAAGALAAGAYGALASLRYFCSRYCAAVARTLIPFSPTRKS